MAGISDLPRLHDIDADYSPQYVKLAGSSATRSNPANTTGATSFRPPISPASTRCQSG